MTTPAELLYTMTRRWLIVVMCVALGTAAAAAKVLTDDTIYEGTATLLLVENDSVVVDQEESERTPRGAEREAFERFFNTRVDLLQRESVVRKLVLALEVPTLLAHAEDHEQPDDHPLRHVLRGIKERLTEVIERVVPPKVEDYDEESAVQRAIASFQQRASVEPDAETSTVELRVVGYDRELLRKELELWIEAYVERLVDLAKETRDAFISSRLSHWRERVREARSALDAYREAHPGVSKAAQDLRQQRINQLQQAGIDLLREEDNGEAAGAASAAEALPEPLPASPARAERIDPGLQTLLEDKAELEAELFAALTVFQPDSIKVRSLRERLELMTAKVEAHEAHEKEEEPAIDTLVDAREREQAAIREREEAARRERQNERQQRRDDIATAIENEMRELATLERDLEELAELETAYASTQETYLRYERMRLEEADREESRRNVQVQVADRPYVSETPYNPPYRQIALGLGAGALLGAFLAIARETVRGKIRFKNDLIGEMGIPVVAVIPKR